MYHRKPNRLIAKIHSPHIAPPARHPQWGLFRASQVSRSNQHNTPQGEHLCCTAPRPIYQYQPDSWSAPPSILAPQSSQYFLVGLSQLPSVVMTKPHAGQHHSSPPRCAQRVCITGATSVAGKSLRELRHSMSSISLTGLVRPSSRLSSRIADARRPGKAHRRRMAQYPSPLRRRLRA